MGASAWLQCLSSAAAKRHHSRVNSVVARYRMVLGCHSVSAWVSRPAGLFGASLLPFS